MADPRIKDPPLSELALRKLMLQQRSAVLRHTLAIQVGEHVAPVLGLADRVVASGQWLKRHPALLVGAAVGLLIWRPKGGVQNLLRWAGRGLTLWQTWQKLQPMVAGLIQAAQAGQGTPSTDAAVQNQSNKGA
jgi:hypothetical protein